MLIGGLATASHRFTEELETLGRFEIMSGAENLGFAVLFIAKPDADTLSVFDEDWGRAGVEALAHYNYGFYRYMFEQQQAGRCPIACDYSSGYHSLVGGARIGVHKSYLEF
ncbi:hypothetical protein [Nocardia sp. NPDC004711]